MEISHAVVDVTIPSKSTLVVAVMGKEGDKELNHR